jgi:hypothetical protein
LQRIARRPVQNAFEVVVEVKAALILNVLQESFPRLAAAACSTGKITTADTLQAQFSPWNSRFNCPSCTSTSKDFSS